jgi:hypothetical protein
MLVTLVLISSLGGGCATTRGKPAQPLSHRIPDSAPERLAGLREAEPETNAAGTEERFGFEKDKERREEARAAKAERERRVDVVDKTTKPPQTPQSPQTQK